MPAHPPRWDEQRLEADRQLAIERFRDERIGESLGAYLENFAHYQTAIERLLSSTDDLAALAMEASAVLADEDLLYTARYLAGPPVSADDLRVLADARLTPASIRADPGSALRAVETILRGLDRERFAWVAEHRQPSAEERRIAVVATAALIASQRVRTGRQTHAPQRQEALVKSWLADAGFVEEPPRPIPTVFAAPDVGRFTGECVVGASRKADIVVRMWDGRIMPIECKVSNSELNSIKRLTNDAAVKARVWIDDLGRNNVVPVAVLSGVFGIRHLVEAQDRGLTLFWAHSLGELISFVSATET
ncbi:MAG: XamI family restriction endonuclease [Chloroflexi bacterium]|nr:XamI family restriction endonuclease [Rhodospirillaceae bacterium]MXX48333.1 XamI family restriction endonuclease [Chloroflexota bacterium]MXY85645.1 XamI family restriction endonuclease [Chloroflexota bacterium]MYB22996.1 XamI family restriction endonuclease [Chloroflexota bacterium]MYD72751.1 XamI family restriction endonuclease [Chloroflexota bacterium]